MGFASQDWLSAKCSFLSLPPFCFHQHLGHRPRATMDKNLDDLGGQKETSDSSKGSDSPGSQQGHYPCMNNNCKAMLNSLQDGGLLPFHGPYKGLSFDLSLVSTTTKNICNVTSTYGSHQARHSDQRALDWTLESRAELLLDQGTGLFTALRSRSPSDYLPNMFNLIPCISWGQEKVWKETIMVDNMPPHSPQLRAPAIRGSVSTFTISQNQLPNRSYFMMTRYFLDINSWNISNLHYFLFTLLVR